MGRINFFDRFFPIKHDFYGMLNKQAQINSLGVEMLLKWVNSKSEKEKEDLFAYVKEADEVRMNMEAKLIDAFMTPFDRADVYSISVAMDKIIEFAKSSLESMEAYGVSSNEVIVNMVANLKCGSDLLYEAIKNLKDNPHKAGENIAKLRAIHVEVKRLYRLGMMEVFESNDPMYAIKQREVYHHIKDASLNLEYTVDIFHKIVVRLI